MSRYRDARRRRQEDRAAGLAQARLFGRLMGSWPELPTPGRFVELPIGVAPTLRAALGDDGARNWLALCWDLERQACVWSDDAMTMHTADRAVWDALTEHPAMRAILAAYQLGDSGQHAEHWLLCEAHLRRLSVGLPADILALLGRQSALPELAVMTALMGSGWVTDQLTDDLLDPRTPVPVQTDPLTDHERHQQRIARLVDWLDARAR